VLLLLVADVDVVLHDLAQKLVEDALVVLVDEAVLEHALRLVRDELVDDLLLAWRKSCLARHHDALDHLGHVTQVLLVVRLDGRRLQLLDGLLIDADTGVHDLAGLVVLVRGERLDDPAAQDPVEDLGQSLRICLGKVEDVEELREALGEFGTRACGRRSHADGHDVLDNLDLLRGAVLECTEADELSQKLDRRLRIELLLQRHIHIVNHQDAPVEPGRWGDHAAHADALKLLLNLLLRNEAAGLRGELHVDWLELEGGVGVLHAECAGGLEGL